MQERLPSLYRPEPRDRDLLSGFLRAVSRVLGEVDRETADVLQTRWIDYADRAAYARFFELSLLLEAELDPLEYPWIRDLARVAALLPLPPWEEPPAQRELVEAYRLRIRRIVELHRAGLATLGALRRRVEAELPVDLAAPPERRDRSFLLEEFAPVQASLQAPTRGPLEEVVGPLMRWTVHNDGLAAAAPTLLVEGVAAAAGETDATTNPLVELHTAGSRRPRVGLGWRGTVAPGQALRFAPAYGAWLGLDTGLARSRVGPTEDASADPTAAAGPFDPAPGAPAQEVAALLQTTDRMLWAATGPAGAASLWRFDGAAWTEALSGQPTLHCLLEDGDDLLIGTDTGLLRMAQHPPEEDPFDPQPVSAAGAGPIRALIPADGGGIWLAGATALSRLGTGDTVEVFVLGSETELEVEVRSVAPDPGGVIHVATDRGVFQYQPLKDAWYWYEGEGRTEQERDWLPFLPDAAGEERNFPGPDAAFLPPARRVHRGPDASLWIGTDAGLARYVARPAASPSGRRVGTSLTFETVLEAFPDLGTEPVHDIREDARGVVWFATGRGVFRFDGRDFWQLRAGAWAQLGRAELLYPADREPEPRGAWRFQRATSRWQRFDPGASTWVDFLDEPRATVEPAVRTVLWTAEVDAHLGDWDGSAFTNPTPVDPAELEVRFKPSDERVVTGGLPGLPDLPTGPSFWRYLRMEAPEDPPPTSTPAWTSEGRLVPPPPEGLEDDPGPARFDVEAPPPPSDFDGSVYAFLPSARVRFVWAARRRRSVLVRLLEPPDGEPLDPAILDRVWEGIQRVRPAGVTAALAVEQTIARGNDGNA
jgi:hypothetical protein